MSLPEHAIHGNAYHRIRNLILAGEIAMGERIVETRIAEQLGQSRTPIREALRLLTSDGLVVFEPNRGYQVVRYTPANVAEIYSCRVLLESEAVRLVAEHGMTLEQASCLEDLLCEADNMFAAGLDPEILRQRFLSVNNQFHQLLYGGCGNQTLLSMIRKVTEIPVGIRHYFRFSDDLLAGSHAAHWKIFRATVNRQPERASALMREHIWTAKDRMVEPAGAAERPRDKAGTDEKSAA
ncbi:MAG: GntR family transcriptional regulator [Pseudomonadota bacterium]